MRAAQLFLLLPSLVLAAACSDDGRSQDLPPGEATLSLDGLVTEQARVFCQLLFSCEPDGSDNLEARLILETPAKCQQFLLSSGTFETGDLVRAVEAGVVRYDGAAAKRCVAAIGQSCESLDFETSPEVCDTVFVGTVAVGGACQRSEECSGATFCAKTSSTTNPVCPSRYTTQHPQKTKCDSSSQYDDTGLTGAPICTYTQEGQGGYIGRCRERKVGAAANVGQVCGFDEATAHAGRAGRKHARVVRAEVVLLYGSARHGRADDPVGGVERGWATGEPRRDWLQHLVSKRGLAAWARPRP